MTSRDEAADSLTVGRTTITLTHPDRLLFPDDGITKRDLAEYLAAMAPHMLPHLRGRPLTLQRFPQGIDGPGFMQKDARGLPDWVHRVEVRKEGGTVTHPIADDAATLVVLANQSCITLHVWLSRVGHLECPDQVIFDLDPSGDDLPLVCEAARALRGLLDELELPAYLKTTGSRGLHVVVPLDGRAGFEEVRAFSHDVATALVARMPDALTTEFRKEKRQGRLFVDTLRSGYAQTAVAPYSVRPLPGAPVAAPLRWEEIDEPGFHIRQHTLRTVPGRVEREGDAWAGMGRRGRSLQGARRRLAALQRRHG
ncbi:MAG TPA: non-homologous end-joining DNA ligase [Candidatus Dormibacteraeota bacterium]